MDLENDLRWMHWISNQQALSRLVAVIGFKKCIPKN